VFALSSKLSNGHTDVMYYAIRYVVN